MCIFKQQRFLGITFYLSDRSEFVNVLDEQYAYRYLSVTSPVYRKTPGFVWQTEPSIDCNECDFLRGGLRVPIFLFFFLFLRSNLSLRVSAEQWDCNGDDWFRAVVSGQAAISQNENQYIVPPRSYRRLWQNGEKKGQEIILRDETLQVNKEKIGNWSHQFETLLVDIWLECEKNVLRFLFYLLFPDKTPKDRAKFKFLGSYDAKF